MSAPENPFAFPWRCDESTMTGDSGMTLRDWFAGQALTMSQPDKPEYLADWAYRVADAMLVARTLNSGEAV